MIKKSALSRFLKLDQLELLLVGGGNVGLEKLHSLLANSPGAKVSIVAPEVKDEIRKLVLRHPSCKIYSAGISI